MLKINKIFSNPKLVILIYGFILVSLVSLEITSLYTISIPFRVSTFLLLILFLYLNFSANEFTKIIYFFFALVIVEVAGVFYLPSLQYYIFGMLFYIVARLLTFFQFYGFCKIRNLKFYKLWVVLIPFLASLFYAVNFTIETVPDPMFMLTLLITFIDSLFLSIIFFYKGHRFVKYLLFLGAILVFITDHIWTFNTYYGSHIGLKLPGYFFNYSSFLVLTLSLYYHIKKFPFDRIPEETCTLY